MMALMQSVLLNERGSMVTLISATSAATIMFARSSLS